WNRLLAKYPLPFEDEPIAVPRTVGVVTVPVAVSKVLGVVPCMNRMNLWPSHVRYGNNPEIADAETVLMETVEYPYRCSQKPACLGTQFRQRKARFRGKLTGLLRLSTPPASICSKTFMGAM